MSRRTVAESLHAVAAGNQPDLAETLVAHSR